MRPHLFGRVLTLRLLYFYIFFVDDFLKSECTHATITMRIKESVSQEEH